MKSSDGRLLAAIQPTFFALLAKTTRSSVRDDHRGCPLEHELVLNSNLYVPHTFMFINGRHVAWWSTASNTVVERHQFSQDDILSALLADRNNDARQRCDIVATVYSQSQDSEDAHVRQTVSYLDTEELVDFITRRSANLRFNGYIQQHIPPVGEYADCIRCNYDNGSVIIERRRNLNRVFTAAESARVASTDGKMKSPRPGSLSAAARLVTFEQSSSDQVDEVISDDSAFSRRLKSSLMIIMQHLAFHCAYPSFFAAFQSAPEISAHQLQVATNNAQQEMSSPRTAAAPTHHRNRSQIPSSVYETAINRAFRAALAMIEQFRLYCRVTTDQKIAILGCDRLVTKSFALTEHTLRLDSVPVGA